MVVGRNGDINMESYALNYGMESPNLETAPAESVGMMIKISKNDGKSEYHKTQSCE